MNSLDQQDSDRWFDPIFERTLQRLSAEMNRPRFNHWLGNLRVISASAERVVLASPTHYVRDCVVEKFGKRIADLIAEEVPGLLAVDFIVDPDARPPQTPHFRPTIVKDKVEPNVAAPTPDAPTDREPPTTKSGNRILIEDVKRIVAAHFAYQVSDLESECRKRSLVRARQIAMALSRELSGQTFPQIGRRFLRDHSTVVHSCDKIRKLCETNSTIAGDMEKLRRAICG